MNKNELTMKDLNKLSLKKLTALSKAHAADLSRDHALATKQAEKKRKADLRSFTKKALAEIPKSLHEFATVSKSNNYGCIVVDLPDAHAPFRFNFFVFSDGKIDLSTRRFCIDDHRYPLEVGYPGHRFDEFAEDENFYYLRHEWRGKSNRDTAPADLLEAIHAVQSSQMAEMRVNTLTEILALNKAQKEKEAEITAASSDLDVTPYSDLSTDKKIAHPLERTAEALEKLVELMTPRPTTLPTPRPEPSDEGELAKKPHLERGEK